VDSFRYPVEEIREKCDLVEIVSAYVALRKRGKTFIGLCPFHNEKTPSFNVNPDRQWWKCFGCGEGGDVFDFVQKIDNASFPEAVERLAQKCGVKIDRSEKGAREYSERERILRANNVASAFFRSAMMRSQAAKDYLVKRGLTDSSIEKYRLGYAPDSWDQLMEHLAKERVSQADAVRAGLIVPRENSQGFYDRFRSRLIFPILDTSERVIAFGGRAMGDVEPKYLNSPESPLFAKNKTLYGLNFARHAVSKEDRLIVVEGYMDAIAAQEAGFEHTVATMGTALTTEHVSVISRFTKNVVLAFDADSAGMNAALRSAPIFEQAGFSVRIMSMPKGEDPDSMLRGGDVSRFAALIEQAQPIPDYRIGLALAKHDLSTDTGKVEALNEAVVVLAEVDGAMDRERLIRELARYHPNFGTGMTLAEDQIRGDMSRIRSRSTRRHSRGAALEDKAPAAREDKPLSLVQKSERLLLGIIIFRGAEASKVFERLPPKEFTDESAQILAELLGRQSAQTGKIDQETLRAEAAGTPAESLLNDLLFGLDESELNHPVEQIMAVIENHKKNEKRQRMRELSRKINEGSIKRGDEEYEEYYRLARETSSPWRR